MQEQRALNHQKKIRDLMNFKYSHNKNKNKRATVTKVVTKLSLKVCCKNF